MALWTDNRKCLLVGRSGLQYQATFLTALSPETARSRITQFYQSHGAVLTNAPDGQELTLIRGRLWVSRMSWLLVLSERWPRHTIKVSFSHHEHATQIQLSYDVMMFFTIVTPPCALTKEARQLEKHLQHDHDPVPRSR